MLARKNEPCVCCNEPAISLPATEKIVVAVGLEKLHAGAMDIKKVTDTLATSEHPTISEEMSSMFELIHTLADDLGVVVDFKTFVEKPYHLQTRVPFTRAPKKPRQTLLGIVDQNYVERAMHTMHTGLYTVQNITNTLSSQNYPPSVRVIFDHLYGLQDAMRAVSWSLSMNRNTNM